MKFLVTSSTWHLSGVNTFAENFLRELAVQGVGSEIVLTDTQGSPPPTSLPEDIASTTLPATAWGAIRERQQMLEEHLNSQAPCVWLPNYDFNLYSVAEVLPREVQVWSILHSDEEIYYEYAGRFGASCQNIIAVSGHIAKKFAQRFPHLEDRLVTIPYGVPIPEDELVDDKLSSHNPDRPLELLYLGRLSRQQKRVQDLVSILQELDRRKIPFLATIAGSGSEEAYLRETLRPLIATGTVYMPGKLTAEEVQGTLSKSDVLLLTSEFEGLPLALLEAMGWGCVPVVTDLPSGMREVIQNGENGFLLPVGGIASFADRIEELHRERERLLTMARAARKFLAEGPYSIRECAVRYLELLEMNRDRPVYRRPGRPTPPPHYSFWWRVGKRMKNCMNKSMLWK